MMAIYRNVWAQDVIGWEQRLPSGKWTPVKSAPKELFYVPLLSPSENIWMARETSKEIQHGDEHRD